MLSLPPTVTHIEIRILQNGKEIRKKLKPQEIKTLR